MQVNILQIVVLLLSRVWLFATPWKHTRLPCPSLYPGVFSDSCLLSRWYYLPYHPLPLSSSFAFNLSQHQGFSSESALHIRWRKYWSFSFNISPPSEYSGLISFRLYWFDLVVQGTLKSLLQHHNLKPSILWPSAFFVDQLSHPYMTIGKIFYRYHWLLYFIIYFIYFCQFYMV